ncbi:MAG: 30S ribosomal protein S9 [Candidatus Shikimatogenerans bostrichidophilus]|nr:MAG: 30S ribosomal protein S9 [Candidatus Shikimatogenerans bostrichidophilus]
MNLIKNKKYYYSIGKRKTSIALVYFFKKKIKDNIIIINNKNKELYFKNNIFLIQKAFLPLKIINNIKNKFFIKIKVKGGGNNSQSESISLAISRILCLINNEYKKELKKNNLLTRDSRIVERKKYGKKKARKKFQFSKR